MIFDRDNVFYNKFVKENMFCIKINMVKMK
jgi:hypothetical protein